MAHLEPAGEAKAGEDARSEEEQGQGQGQELGGAEEAGDPVAQDKLDALRERLSSNAEACALVKSKDLQDASLGRFLRARDGDVDAAFAQMLNVLRWRREHKVDLILERDYEFVAQDRWGMAYWHGKDNFGRPILIIRGIRHDPTLFSTETTVRYLIWKLETKLTEPDVDDVVVIFDFINMGRHNLDMRLVRIMIPLLLNFYPERLGVCLVYPTLQIMWILWKMVSKAFDEKTEKKFVFVREQKRDNKFLRLIPADQLQTRFGGTSTAEFGTDLLGLIPPDSLVKGETSEGADDFAHHRRLQREMEDNDPQKGQKMWLLNGENQEGAKLDLGGEDLQQQAKTSGSRGATERMRPRGLSQDCVGPRAFASLSLDAESGAFDADVAVREYEGPIIDEDDDFRAFMDARDQDIDRFQVRLRYQVSHLCMDSPDSNSDDASSTISPASDSHTYGANNIHVSMSDVGTVATSRTTGAKRARIKQFFRRKVLRRRSDQTTKKKKKELAATSSLDQLLTKPPKDESTIASEIAEAAEAAAALQAARAQAEEDARILYTRLRSTSGSTSQQMHEQHVKAQSRPRMEGMEHRSLSSSNLLPQSPSRRGVGTPGRATSFRRSRRHRGSREEKVASLGFTPDKIKFVMEAGASMKRVPYDDPGRECNTWSPCSAARFMTRIGPDYKRKKLKEPSGSAIYDCVCMDVWSLQSKRPNIGSYMQLPTQHSQSTSGAGPGAPDAAAPLPELLIVNIMMPGYPPSGPFSKKRIDGPGQSIVLFAKLSNWAKENPEDPSVQLWSRFVHVYDGDKFRERLKMITRLENADEINLGRIERALLTKYNGTPWLVRPEYEFHKGEGYFEICIDFHRFAYFALSNAMPVLDRVFNAMIDCALIVQAEKDQEMPERVLVCATLRCLNLKEAPEIDLVALTDESKRKSSRLHGVGTSFIDRDGRVHSLAKHSQTPTSARRVSDVAEGNEPSPETSPANISNRNKESSVRADATTSRAAPEGKHAHDRAGLAASGKATSAGKSSGSARKLAPMLMTFVLLTLLAFLLASLYGSPSRPSLVEEETEVVEISE
ncbi:Phosphatidylinositol/phosphatidylcholine transfer protein SFH4 [Hondaea fermentalgiana]|uniref:Phosphatidylinositol/phosphatidylcholine transfer protein SFH4 n=1 Tax=Hondaea fermentalgiana TaxID=2315210 RepID=A0A2R5G7X0_9STRA|nr:Phosphatidylinositol/phosphatidylcholine transfer protein SFH4 [Hondaea fermentalgiana]|eukprot:GBG24583.1 Phosphatidylinositol/phosphatidylcholine transfer protein SFH4 [Hondaea fermentalgiana]